MELSGLAPYGDPRRPRAAPRWWSAAGAVTGGRLVIRTLAEAAAPPPALPALVALAAPTSLPREFLETLGAAHARDVALTAQQLRARARAWAAHAPRGRKHPRRAPEVSVSALDPRRLPLFHAALPLLRARDDLIEADVASLLAALALPARGLAGPSPAAVLARARVLQALHEGVLGPPLDLRERDFAIASRSALDAVLAAALAAWVHAGGHERPAGAEAWIPLP